MKTKLEKITKNLISGPISAQIWASEFFFVTFHLYQMIGIVTSYHCMQSQGELMNQTWGNGKKPYFGSDIGSFGPTLGLKKNFS